MGIPESAVGRVTATLPGLFEDYAKKRKELVCQLHCYYMRSAPCEANRVNTSQCFDGYGAARGRFTGLEV